MNRDPEVEAYFARCPPKVRRRLRAVRKLVRAAEPNAEEVFSYGMPGYRYPGHEFRGPFAWFGLRSNHIGLYVRPPTIANHRRRLSRYGTTKSAVHLPLEGELPTKLIRTLVQASSYVVRARKP